LEPELFQRQVRGLAMVGGLLLVLLLIRYLRIQG